MTRADRLYQTDHLIGKERNFHDKLFRAKLFALCLVGVLAEIRKDDDGYCSRFRVGLHLAQDLEAVDAGKKNVEKNNVGGIRLQNLKRRFAPPRGARIEFLGHLDREQPRKKKLVLNDEN